LDPLTPGVIMRRATINIGAIGHVVRGRSTVIGAILGMQTIQFKHYLKRNIAIKLRYVKLKIYKCNNDDCPQLLKLL
ncbi:hypothetical protein BGZ60DRAFT_385807, partial [Tricladium varicosporioides]